jgi:hypothetical protein
VPSRSDGGSIVAAYPTIDLDRVDQRELVSRPLLRDSCYSGSGALAIADEKREEGRGQPVGDKRDYRRPMAGAKSSRPTSAIFPSRTRPSTSS